MFNVQSLMLRKFRNSGIVIIGRRKERGPGARAKGQGTRAKGPGTCTFRACPVESLIIQPGSSAFRAITYLTQTFFFGCKADLFLGFGIFSQKMIQGVKGFCNICVFLITRVFFLSLAKNSCAMAFYSRMFS
jgi:hypothetical protein